METLTRTEHNNNQLLITAGRFEQLDQSSLTREGILIAAAAFGVPTISYDFEQDVLNHLQGHDVVFVHSQEQPVGFVSTHTITTEQGTALYISGMAVRPEFQSQGVGKRLAREAATTMRQSGKTIDYILGKTQNPVVARSRAGYCNTVYPVHELPSPPVSQVVQEVKQKLALVGELDESLLVVRNSYSSPMYASRPRSGQPQFDSFFDQHVGPHDAVFIIGSPNI